MRVVLATALVLLAFAIVHATGCLRTTAFQCSDSTDCARGGGPGVCEPTGFCSFDDGNCNGGRRYGELSGPFAGQCIGGEVTPDAPPFDPDAPDAPDAPMVAPFCDAAGEPTLVGCWEFENTFTDASGANDGIGTGTSFAAGQLGMGAVLVAASHIAVADSLSLTSPSISIEGWINPTALPGVGTRQGIFDNEGQYGLFLQPGGLQCINVVATVALVPGVFTHVACTYDGTTGRLYVNGSEVAVMGGGAPLGAGDNTGSAIAGNSPANDTLVGVIDQLRIWNVARTAQQICTAAGKTVCP